MNHEQERPLNVRAAQLNEAFDLFTHQEGWALGSQRFYDHYRGTWSSLEDYGRQLAADLGLNREHLLPQAEWLAPFVRFDYSAFAIDDLRRDSMIIEGVTGLHIFDRCAEPSVESVESTTGAA